MPLYPLRFVISLAVLIFMKLWLVRGQTLFAIGEAGYDDRLFLNLADHLANGRWLGPYNNLTLVKGMFYPLWIAITYTLGIPLLFAQQLLYVVACCVLIIALRPVVKHKFLLVVIFIFLLFNPMSFSSDVARVLREGIYPALTLLVIACALGFLTRCKKSASVLSLWSIGLGMCLSAFWLTREEGIWILPSILIIIAVATIQIVRISPFPWKRFSFSVLPFIIWLMSLGIVAAVNEIYYGTFTTNELKKSEFLAAYGALLRVKHHDRYPTVPVPKETRERIYDISPAFAEVKPFMEGDIGKRWGRLFKDFRELSEKNPEVAAKLHAYLGSDRNDMWAQLWNSGELFTDEIHGGWFLWTLREVVTEAGYNSSHATLDYYRRLSAEINDACDKGLLECLPKRKTLMPPWNDEYIKPLLHTFFRHMGYLVRFSGFEALSNPSLGTEQSLRFFKKLTRERLSPVQIQIRGWVFSPYGAVTLSVHSENGDLKSADMRLNLPSDDVYNYFLAQGRDIPQARYARFDITTYCGSECFLYIKSGDHREKLPLEENTKKTIENPSLQLTIDSFEYNNSSRLKAKIDAMRIDMLDSIGRVYQYGIPIVSMGALLSFLTGTVFLIRSRSHVIPLIFSISVLTAILVRVCILSLIHITSFPTINTQYLSAAYPLLIVFVVSAFLLLKKEHEEAYSSKNLLRNEKDLHRSKVNTTGL